MKNNRLIQATVVLLIGLASAASSVAQTRILDSGKKLKAGEELIHKQGLLVMRHIGSLTLYDVYHNVEWESGSYVHWGEAIQYLHMNKNGDLEVVVKEDDTNRLKAIWSSKTSEQHPRDAPGAHLEVDWQNFILKIVSKTGKELWRSR